MKIQTPYSSLIIVGGGTAGWMSAAWLRHHLPTSVSITLVESDDIGTIGVGEGTTPHLKQFFNTLGIAEKDWMNQCEATFKNGITFKDWGGKNKPNSYFHPFPSASDRHSAGLFLHSVEAKRNSVNTHANSPSHPDSYFLSWHLTQAAQSPIQSVDDAPIPLSYAYHFDAGLLGRFLRKWSETQGVKRVEGKISAVNKHPNGDIAGICVSTQEESISGDLFIDCSGFHGIIGQKQLNIPFVSYANSLLNDSAVAMPSEAQSPTSPQTLACAMKAGWRWQIPLQHRTGNGYVYSSEFIDKHEAEAQLCEQIGAPTCDAQPKHLKLKVGRLATTWSRNCLCVGLSQGFIEPLEATALHLVQTTLGEFTRALNHYDTFEQAQTHVNNTIAERFDGIKDYIVAHYVVSSRQDSDYWNAARGVTQSDELKAVLHSWDTGGNVIAEIERLGFNQFYHPISWYCLLAGYGRLPAFNGIDSQSQQWQTLQRRLMQWKERFYSHSDALLQLQ